MNEIYLSPNNTQSYELLFNFPAQGHWFRLVQVDFTHDGPMKKIPLLIIEEVLCSTIAHFSNESLLFIRFIFGLAYYYQTYFSNWVELSFRRPLFGLSIDQVGWHLVQYQLCYMGSRAIQLHNYARFKIANVWS